MNIPEDRKYTKEHEWIKKEGDLLVTGITDFAQSELGEIVFVELPEVEQEYAKEEAMCVVESTKAASDVYMPISATVAEVNETLEDEPGLLNSAPFEAGWIMKLKGFSEEEFEGLLSAADYQALISE